MNLSTSVVSKIDVAQLGKTFTLFHELSSFQQIVGSIDYTDYSSFPNLTVSFESLFESRAGVGESTIVGKFLPTISNERVTLA